MIHQFFSLVWLICWLFQGVWHCGLLCLTQHIRQFLSIWPKTTQLFRWHSCSTRCGHYFFVQFGTVANALVWRNMIIISSICFDIVIISIASFGAELSLAAWLSVVTDCSSRISVVVMLWLLYACNHICLVRLVPWPMADSTCFPLDLLYSSFLSSSSVCSSSGSSPPRISQDI